VVGDPLHVRVGIATGIVVVGDLLGSGEAQERGVVGDTPNLAARLEGIAEPDSVVIAEVTRKLLGDLFELLISARNTSRGSPDRRVHTRR
jgi:class 3 adenylate cyclase